MSQAKESKSIGIVISSWYKEDFMNKMLKDALNVFKKNNINPKILWVPGSFELPFGAQKLILKGADAVLALGVIIRGDTSHYDHICECCSYGIMKVSLDYKKPVIFGVLTCENQEQVKNRINKAKDCANALIDML